MIGDTLRNISSTFNRFGDLISPELVNIILDQINVLLDNSLRVKKEIVSHAAILFVTIKRNRMRVRIFFNSKILIKLGVENINVKIITIFHLIKYY